MTTDDLVKHIENKFALSLLIYYFIIGTLKN